MYKRQVVWREAVKSSYKSEVLAKSGKHLNTFKEDFKSLFDQNLHKKGLLYQDFHSHTTVPHTAKTYPLPGLTLYLSLIHISGSLMPLTDYLTADELEQYKDMIVYATDSETGETLPRCV